MTISRTSLGWPLAAQARRVRLRIASATVLGAALLVGGIAGTPSAGAATQPTLLPALGQFVSVPITDVLDATPVAAGATLAVPVTEDNGDGVADDVPEGASAVVVVIKSSDVTAPGFISAWDSDSGDSGVASLGLNTGIDAQEMETVPIGSSGSVSLTNHSSGSASVSLRVTGYYTGLSPASAGDTYTGVPWAEIADTSTGLGTTEAPLAAGASVTIQVSGEGGIPAGADTAVLQVNAFSAPANGTLEIYPAGTTPGGLTALTYGTDGTTYRNMFYAPLSSSGAVTVTNEGSAAVGFTLYTRGYFMPPATTPAGDEYTAIDPDVVDGTASAGTTIAAGASATVQVGGDGIIPSSGVDAVSEDVIVTNSAGTGYLKTGTPGGTLHAAVNFLPTTDTYVGYDNSILTQVSASGEEEIDNDSDGPIDVQIAVVGYYTAPTAPDAPDSVAASTSGTSATITWQAPATDGGSPITSYTVSASPDSASVTVDPGTYQATLTGLADASTDTFTVTASNAVGTSVAADPLNDADTASFGEDAEVEADASTDTYQVVGSSAILETTSNGVTTDTTETGGPVTTSDSVATSGEACDISKYNGVTVKTHDPFNQAATYNSFSVEWINHYFSVSNARKFNNTWQWEAIICSVGGANTWNSWDLKLAEDSIFVNATNSNHLWGYNYGVKTTSASSISKSLGFSVQTPGSYASINGSEEVSVVAPNAELNGGVGSDGHWGGAWPSQYNQYDATRINAEWESKNKSGWSSSFEGNTGLALYMFPMGSGNHYFHSFHLTKAVCTLPEPYPGGSGCKSLY